MTTDHTSLLYMMQSVRTDIAARGIILTEQPLVWAWQILCHV